jgi:glycosyltransferase involved in cell wall biosynthesis
MTALISVILPAHNAEKYISDSLNSILKQTYDDFELIIADDGSRDKTKEIMDSFSDKRIKRYHNVVNCGKTETVNKLYRHALGKFLTIHDADDISLSHRFERQINAFDENPDLGMCGTGFINMDEMGRDFGGPVFMCHDYQEIMDGIKRTSQFHGPTMMIKKSVVDTLGQVYRSYFSNYNEDTDLAYRIAEKNYSYNLPEVLYRYRNLSSSLSHHPFNVRRRYLYKVVAFLADERRLYGTDSLENGNVETVEKYIDTITEEYSRDPSLIFRDSASYYMYCRYYRHALQESLMAIANAPLNIINYRTLFYCLRKSLVRI